MKLTVRNLSFNLGPIALEAHDSNASKPEDVDVNIHSEGGGFGIEELTMEISIAELSSFCGKTTTTATTTAPEAPASNKADEALDIARAIMHKVDDLKKSIPAPKAPASRSKKAPTAPTVGKIEADEDEYI